MIADEPAHPLALTREQRAIGELARDFARQEIAPHVARWDREHTFPRGLYAKLNAVGLMGMLVPEAFGGVDAGHVSYALAVEELAKVDAGTAVTLSVHSMICAAIARLGTAAQKDAWLPKLGAGDCIAGFALTEPDAGSDAAAIRGGARRDGDAWVLDGRKQWCTNGSFAGVIMAMFRTGGAGIGSRADSRRLRIHDRVSRRALLSGCEGHGNLRRHLGNPAAHHRAPTAGPGRWLAVCPACRQDGRRRLRADGRGSAHLLLVSRGPRIFRAKFPLPANSSGTFFACAAHHVAAIWRMSVVKLMEYQGKDLFRRVGIPTPRGTFATTSDDVRAFIDANPGSWVLKSQVMMGGRGKAGGIKFADDAAQGDVLAKELIGKVLKNVQNPDGEEVKSLLVEEKVAIASEAYVSITIDRAKKQPVIMVTAQGGMDVEEVAAEHPEAIAYYWVDPAAGYSPFMARQLAFAAELPAGYHKAFPKIVGSLYDLFMKYGASLVEINPLVLTKDGNVIASDAKVDLDDNGLYKHPDIAEWNRQTPADEDQAAAVAIGLGMSNYAKLDGSIGVIANGAGLGMGTMDAIRSAGGAAANFLDIGGGAQAELVRKSYSLVVSDPKVKALFINIFGGITRGDQVARGIVEALGGSELRKVPLVVRLTGTNAKEGLEILAKAGYVPVETMDEGAARVVALAQGVN